MDVWIAYAILIMLNGFILFTDDNDELLVICTRLSSLIILGVWITGVIAR